MKIKLRESARHHLSAEDAVVALRERCEKFHPAWTPIGVTVARQNNPQGWEAKAVLEREEEW